jgi:PAS domain S-box-containing protein
MTTDFLRKTCDRDKDYYLLVIDGNGVIHFANSHLLTNFELNQEKILRTGFFGLLDSTQLKNFRHVLAQVKQTRQPAVIEMSACNGSLHWIKWEISLQKNAHHSAGKFFCIGYDITGKSNAQKLKQVARRNYEAIMEGLTIGVVLQDCNGEILAANRKAAEIFDTSIEALYNTGNFKGIWQSMEVEGQQVHFEECPCMKALKSGMVQSNVSVSLKSEAGEVKTLLINSQPLFETGNGRPVSVVSSFMDITVEKRFEKKAMENEMLFHAFNEHTPNLAWMVDEDARLMYANQSFFNYLGLTEKAVGQNIVELIPPEIGEALVKKHRQVMDTGQAQQSQEKMFLANGLEIVFWIGLFPIHSVSGKRLIGGEAINITNRFKTEQKLQQVNERLYYLSHITTDAIWEWDIQTGQIFRNQILQELTGFSLQQASSLSWWFRRVHPDDRRKLRDTLKGSLEKKEKSWESEYRFKNASGQYIIVYDRGYIFYENDVPVKMIGSLHDVTQLKHLELKLLEDKIQHQKEITETIFAVQEKERTQIGHELHDNVNQILSTAKLFTDMIVPSTPEGEQLKYKVSEYLISAIEEIRRLSKEMVTPQLKENGLVTSIKTLVTDLKTAGALHVLFHYCEEVEKLSSGKKVTFFRIVQEQVRNILKHSKAKNLCIDLQAKDQDAVLIIRDDGVGFDPGQTRIGIGLSNIYERTRFYNGTVFIKTSPGKGCRLTVTIPLIN